jgi:hypothetical protein
LVFLHHMAPQWKIIIIIIIIIIIKGERCHDLSFIETAYSESKNDSVVVSCRILIKSHALVKR